MLLSSIPCHILAHDKLYIKKQKVHMLRESEEAGLAVKKWRGLDDKRLASEADQLRNVHL